MSASNVELIRRIFPSGIDMAAVMRSDDPAGAFQADPDAVAPDLEVKFAASPAGAAGFEGRGLEGLVEGWQDWLIPWESYVITVDEFVAGAVEAGYPSEVAAGLGEVFATVLDGRNVATTGGVAEALGRPPRDFAEFAAAAWASR